VIGVKWDGGHVAWISPSNVLIDGEETRPRRVLSQPATDVVALDEEGAHGEQEVRLKPGTAQHARAALRRLPGAVTLIDEGDT
jgi:hypothetical protein